jgi:L-arabinokinase
MTRSPGVADVMGGIVEDSGSLVLTTTLDLAISASLWTVGDDQVRVRLVEEAADTTRRDCHLPLTAFDPSATGVQELIASCRQQGFEWALPTFLTLQRAIADELIPRLGRGLMILLHSDFPPDADLGHRWVQAASTIDGLTRLFGSSADGLQKSRTCAEAMAPWTDLYNLRTAMTALCGPPDGSLLQLRFYPQTMCEAMELPAGVIVLAARTRLARPTTHQRLVDTRMCAEMGRRMISELQRLDGMVRGPASGHLAAITPAEYVERYRDRLPSKISGKAFVARFGSLRGLNGELDPQGVYKLRSRAEHHIYENRRVHDFATCIVRARRNASVDELIDAGKLMYASHWSHSQRCGIGGVEADQLVTAIRKHGPEAGLFGAKVTGSGKGCEVVVLMRDDQEAHAALAKAIATAEAAANHPISTFVGSLGGAEFFQPPELDDVVGSAATV